MWKEGICIIVVGVLLYCMSLCVNMVVPFDVARSSYEVERLSIKMVERFNIDKVMADNIVKVSLMEGVDPRLVFALIYSESSFNPYAVSVKGYRGLMQIKWDIPYIDVHTLLGIRVLKEKLVLESGDLRRALLRYKGYDLNSKRGKYIVDKVLVLYEFLKEEVSI